jgi:hypothetical protein
VTREEVYDIATQAAELAATKTASRMLMLTGINIEDAIEQQKDAAFVRTMRIGTQNVGWKAFGALAVLLVGGWATATWLGLKSMFTGH